jgi:membrane-bound lytic murein transglycosylase B
MRRITLFFKIFLISGLLLLAMKTVAQDSGLTAFIQSMSLRHGFDPVYLERLFAQTKIYQSAIKASSCTVSPTPGKKKPWYEYRKNFINQQRIEAGQWFSQQHAAILAKAEMVYGVPAEIIAAIIGVETLYRENTGNYSVLGALRTLAFHCPRRAEFFTKELEHYLLLTREEGIDPLSLKGSYAGAMGLGQFMPSSYRHFAVDFDGDGHRDLWSNVADTVGSVANYLQKHGWRRGQAVMEATQVQPQAVTTLLALEFKPQYTVKQLKQMGLLLPNNDHDDYLCLLVDLETEVGTLYWAAFENFYAITRYNRSSNYAMAVYQLAQRIAESYVQVP